MHQLTGTALTYVFFYLSASIVSVLPSYFANQKNPNFMAFGSSGAISALLFAFILLQPWTLIIIVFVPVPAVFYAAFYLGYSIWVRRKGDVQFNYGTQLAGPAFGILFMLCMQPLLGRIFLDQLLHPHFG